MGSLEGCVASHTDLDFAMSQGHLFGIEPYNQLQQRMLSQIRECILKHWGKTIAVVSHKRALQALLAGIFAHESLLISRLAELGNASVTCLAYTKDWDSGVKFMFMETNS
jgi:broad specificity phosphatase PhoE